MTLCSHGESTLVHCAACAAAQMEQVVTAKMPDNIGDLRQELVKWQRLALEAFEKHQRVLHEIQGLTSGKTVDDIASLHRQIDDLIGYNQRMRDALMMVIANDKTVYQHHERRPSDGALPESAGGTVWRTPAEIAKDFLYWARKKRVGEIF